MLKPQPLCTYEYDRIFIGILKLRKGHVQFGWVLNSMTDIIIREENTQKCKQKLYEDKGRDWSESSASQGNNRFLEATRSQVQAWDGFSFRPDTRNRPCANTFILNSRPPELWMNKFLSCLTTQFVVICYGKPKKLMQKSNKVRTGKYLWVRQQKIIFTLIKSRTVS